MTSFSILVTDTFRPVYLYLDIMTSYTLSPFLLTRVQTAVDFYFHVLLHAAYFCFFFLILFLSFPETNLGRGREGSVEDEGYACTYKQRLLSSVDNLCKQFGPRSGPTACQDRMCLNSHGQEN